jgi:hypothetical protein
MGQLLPRLDVPEPRRGSVAGGPDRPPVGADGQGDDLPRVAPDVATQQDAARPIPEAHRATVASGHDPRRPRVEGDGRDRVDMMHGLVPDPLPVERQVPQSCRAVPAAQRESPAVGAEGDLLGRDLQGTEQGTGLPQGLHIPEPGASRSVPPGQSPSRVGAVEARPASGSGSSVAIVAAENPGATANRGDAGIGWAP